MKLRILTVTTAALLAACSSSKKSTPSYAPAHNVSYTGPMAAVPITSKAQVASTASGTYGSVAGSGVGQFTGVMGVAATPTLSVADAARLAVRAGARIAASPEEVSGATVSGSDKCQVSGTISGTITAQDTDNPFRHAGDSGQMTFALCDEGSGVVVDGTISITINAADGIDFMGAEPYQLTTGFAYAATLAFGDFTITSANNGWMGIDGNITFGLARRTSPSYQLEESISGTGLAYAVGQGSTILEGSLLAPPTGQSVYQQKVVTEFTDATLYTERDELTTINGKVCSVAMGGCVQVVTLTPVADWSGDANPRAGEFVITSGNAEIIFDILSVTSVDVGYDFDTTVDPPYLTTAHVTWACLDANTCTF
jgi:hypothetical protein